MTKNSNISSKAKLSTNQLVAMNYDDDVFDESDSVEMSGIGRQMRMQHDIIRRHLKSASSRKDILMEYCAGKRVLDIGCVQHDVIHSSSEEWLHRSLVDMASYVLGVDYLPDAVHELKKHGYNVVLGDVNKPLPIDETFDVIVIGNLIEHLSNFEGLFKNINQLLSPGGVALISTANPFFQDQYFFSAFKNTIIVNQEHTCWIDPITLDQLCSRFSLITTDVRWIMEKWKLEEAICHNQKRALDNFSGKWLFFGDASIVERLVSPIFTSLIELFVSEKKVERLKSRYKKDFSRYLYLKAVSVVFGVYWRLRSALIPVSDINKYELFFSVVRRESR
jgi:2-polyprenyl-3-methyl-5-hydroxy-6-metoxy-1,4-benzoquinol methylase